LYPCVQLQISDPAIPHQIITYLRVSLDRPTVKTPTAGAHHRADRCDHWANLKDLFININPIKVADCYFVHMHRWINSSSSRTDPSANGYIDLDYSARLHLALQRRCTAAANLDDPVQLRLVPQCPRAKQRRVRLLRLREEARRPASDYFDFARRLGGPPAITSTSRGRSVARRRLLRLLVSTRN
jgi:hypothetical protein